MRFHDYEDKHELIQKIKDIHIQTIHGEVETASRKTRDLTNAMLSVRYLSRDYHRFSDKTSPKRLVAVIVSAGVTRDYDRLTTEMKLLTTDGFDFISIGKGIKRY